MLPQVHIIGGGMAGLSTAYQLSGAGWQHEFSGITIYQSGWRPGGKAASGRRTSDLRIEEHGLHIWFGSYVNSFRMMQDCFAELDDISRQSGVDQDLQRWWPGLPSIEAAFEASNSISATEFTSRGVDVWTAEFPEVPGRPWDRQVREPTLIDQMGLAFLHTAEYVRSAVAESGMTRRDSGGWQALANALEGAGRQFTGDADESGTSFARSATAVGAVTRLLNADVDVSRIVSGAASLLIRLVDRVSDVVAFRLDHELATGTAALRRAWQFVDLTLAIARGLLRDGRLLDEDLDALDDMDFADWLVANGATTDSANCAIVRAVVYDLAFAYEGGNVDLPRCGAGTALRGMLRLFFTYRGSILWRMRAGMGDVVIAPLYELLVKRGVTFQFFHHIEKLKLDKEGARVARIRVAVQRGASWTDGNDRRPRTDNLKQARERLSVPAPGQAGKDMLCWPSVPAGLDESTARLLETTAGPGAEPVDYPVAPGDYVVVAIPVSCLTGVAPDLVARQPSWQNMVDQLKTVATQSAQLWCTRPLRAPVARRLGRTGPPSPYLVGGYVEPFDTWADMSHLLRTEKHDPKWGVTSLAYLCNVLGDDVPKTPGTPAKNAVEQVKQNVHRFLVDDATALWTSAGIDDGHGGGELDWQEFDWAVLAFQDNAAPARTEDAQLGLLSSHYLRANTQPTERYVQSLPGTTLYRLRPDRSGFQNVWLAGDWTYCGLNSGCIEAAVTSGMVAARAISERLVTDIFGWPYPRERRKDP